MSNSAMKSIPEQIRLPLGTAIRIVARGIRLRLGRSVVTLLGVALGIAFLMATFTAEVLRQGVTAEDARRDATSREYGLLASETGPLRGKRIALVVTGTPSDAEHRLLVRVAADAPAEFTVPPGTPAASLGVPTRTTADFSRDASVLLVLGQGPLPALAWPSALGAARPALVAFTSTRPDAPPPTARLVRLTSPASADDLAERTAATRRDRVRLRWIVVISLLVTVIGIANSMLMSVTERFRDIGTMKCLGALSSLVRTLFLLEAAFMGTVGGVAGVAGGALFAFASYLLPYGGSLVLGAFAQGAASLAVKALLSLAAGVVLSIVAALYPAAVAARMVPADALRSSV